MMNTADFITVKGGIQCPIDPLKLHELFMAATLLDVDIESPMSLVSASDGGRRPLKPLPAVPRVAARARPVPLRTQSPAARSHT